MPPGSPPLVSSSLSQVHPLFCFCMLPSRAACPFVVDAGLPPALLSFALPLIVTKLGDPQISAALDLYVAGVQGSYPKYVQNSTADKVHFGTLPNLPVQYWRVSNTFKFVKLQASSLPVHLQNCTPWGERLGNQVHTTHGNASHPARTC